VDSSWLALALSALAGAALGALYFGGLWLTVQKMRQAKNPGLLMLGSFWARTILVIGGFYLIADGKLERLAVALFIFTVTRYFFIRHFKPKQEQAE
jgi:F1F0 ATPase subunit 2